MPFLQRAARISKPLIWIGTALLAGILAGSAPPSVSLPILGGAALLILSLIDLRAALFALLIFAPFKALIETESAIQLPLDIGQILLILTLGLWAMKSVAARRSLGLTYSPIYPPLLVFLFAAALSLLQSVLVAATLNELIKWAQLTLMVALSIALATEFGVGWLVAALMASGCVQALVGVYQFQGGSGAPHLWILDFRYFRAFGGFGQPNPFGAFMGLTLPLALGALYGAFQTAYLHKTDRQGLVIWAHYGLLCLAGTAIIGIGLLVSWSRGAWLGFGAALGVMILFGPKRRWRGLAIGLLCAIGLIFAILTGILPDALTARFSDFAQDLSGFQDVRGVAINDANYAVIERLAHWQAAFAMAEDHPLIGVGFGAYEIAYPRYALVNWPHPLGHAHNYYLNLLAEVGVIGLGAYLLLWLSISWLTMRALGRLEGFRRGVALGLLGVWTHLAVHSLFDKLYVNNLFLHVGVLLGLISILVPVANSVAQSSTAQCAKAASIQCIEATTL